MRRGRTTCHKAFGEDVAILAGDGLYAEACALLLAHQHGQPASIIAAARELAVATGVRGMVGGQYLDVAGSAPDGPDGLRRLHELKTGRLIAAEAKHRGMKPILAGRSAANIEKLAGELGLAARVFDLADPAELDTAFRDVELAPLPPEIRAGSSSGFSSTNLRR